ncbi:MAG: heavy-metal-associated domain-containing protein [Methylobacillus glycogenes]|nr:heavy-metal-associated domain-containing protein [Methylobacillus glycogenes]
MANFNSTFQVADMSCQHCVQAITQAALAVDAQAQVNIDLAAKTVQIASDIAPEQFRAAITEAGYTPG